MLLFGEQKFWNVKKRVEILLKVLLVVLLAGVLYYQITQNEQLTLGQLYEGLAARWSWGQLRWLLPAVLLIGLNWGLETEKWRILMRPVAVIPFRQAGKAVLAGLTFSLFTPNRIGEYGGRMLLVRNGQRMNAVLATLVGSMAQWWVLWTGGVCALIAFGWYRLQGGGGWGLVAMEGGGLLVSLVLLWGYFNIHKVLYRMTGWRWVNRWALRLWDSMAKHYTKAELRKVLVFAALRYAVYSSQYYLLLCLWGYPVGLADGLLAIALIFFLQTGLPIPPATGLVIRGNIAVWVFGYWGIDTTFNLSLLAATWSLWLMNVVLPALVGGGILLGLRREGAQ